LGTGGNNDDNDYHIKLYDDVLANYRKEIGPFRNATKINGGSEAVAVIRSPMGRKKRGSGGKRRGEAGENCSKKRADCESGLNACIKFKHLPLFSRRANKFMF
jgi:hypothetical protein